MTFDGVCNLTTFETNIRDLLYKQTHVSEVWGVGRQHSKKLEAMGISKVYDLMMANPYHIESLFSVVMKRTVLELNGIALKLKTPHPHVNKSFLHVHSSKNN